MKRVVKSGLAGLACLLAAGAASAQPPSAARQASFADIQRRMEQNGPGDGYALSNGILEVLAEGRSAQINVEIDPKMQNAIVARCDDACGDIDLSVFNADGKLIDSDVDNDDEPVVQLPSGLGASVTVKVDMVACSESPCAYGLAVYLKSAAPPVSVDSQIKALSDLFN